MPAVAKKSSAYREGRADKKKPSIEIEISAEGEEEEGEEMDATQSHSRKRSAKGVKNTKAPMDGMYGKKPMDGEGCGCGNRKGKCDGSCGKKMDSAPSPFAKGFGFDMENLRIDLKCGNGAISEGEKCTKGPATKVTPQQAARTARKQEQTIVKGYQKMSFKQLNQQSSYLNRELNNRIKNEYKKPVENEEQLNEFYNYLTRQPEYKEAGYLNQAYGNKVRNRNMRRTVGAMVGVPLVASAAAASALSRRR